mgnify:CR=1 FL=1|jgi:hypothetical protein|nr:DUF5360 family protein [uncultured Emticicia sp.]
MKTLRYIFLVTDIGFIIYWLITLLKFIPDEYLYQDYTNELLIAWNWSFFPLDICVSFTGLLSLYLWEKQNDSWEKLALISLILTFCSGLQAISFWIIRKDFDITWWLPNLFLVIYPLFFIHKILKTK